MNRTAHSPHWKEVALSIIFCWCFVLRWFFRKRWVLNIFPQISQHNVIVEQRLFLGRESFPHEVNFFRYVFETKHKTPTPLPISQDVSIKYTRTITLSWKFLSDFLEKCDSLWVTVSFIFPPCFEQQFKWRCYLAIMIELVEFQLISNNVSTKMHSGHSMQNIYGIRHMVSILLVFMMGQDKRIEIGTNVYSLDSQLSF